jgi:hypothetical protein
VSGVLSSSSVEPSASSRGCDHCHGMESYGFAKESPDFGFWDVKGVNNFLNTPPTTGTDYANFASFTLGFANDEPNELVTLASLLMPPMPFKISGPYLVESLRTCRISSTTRMTLPSSSRTSTTSIRSDAATFCQTWMSCGRLLRMLGGRVEPGEPRGS